jgi:hypothetical protein
MAIIVSFLKTYFPNFHFCLGGLFLFSYLNAQEIQRFEIPMSQLKVADKSILGAVVLSAIFPGNGELYLKPNTGISAFHITELTSWFAVFALHQYSRYSLNRGASHARKYAGASGFSTNEKDLQIMGDYRSRDGIWPLNTSPDLGDSYEHDRLRSAEKSNLEEQFFWNWGPSGVGKNEQNYQDYKGIMKNYRRSRIGFQVAVGALVMNRVLSMVHVFRIHRQGSFLSDLQFNPMLNTWSPGMEMVVPF